MLSSASFAQQYEYKLSEMNSKYTPEYYKYMYDEDNGRLDSTAHYYELDGYVYDTGNKYVYDEQGNEVLEKGYQKFSGDGFYTYSTQIRYTYDEKGRLDEEKYYSAFFGGEMEFSNGYKYVYDDKDRVVEKLGTMLDLMTYEIVEAGGEVFEYDANGNIEEWYKYNESKDDVTQRELYTFDTAIESAKTLYPVENEWDGTAYLTSKNAVLTDTVYNTDWITGELGLYDELMMEYTQVTSTGINTLSPTAKTIMQVAYDNGTVRLTGISENEQVRVYSPSGLMMNMKNYNPQEGIDMSNIPSGAYIISTKHGSVKVWKK